MFSIKTSNVHTDPSIDELFPLECKANLNLELKEDEEIKKPNPLETTNFVAASEIDTKIRNKIVIKEENTKLRKGDHHSSEAKKAITNLVPTIKVKRETTIQEDTEVTENFGPEDNEDVLVPILIDEIVSCDDDLTVQHISTNATSNIKIEPTVHLVALESEKEKTNTEIISRIPINKIKVEPTDTLSSFEHEKEESVVDVETVAENENLPLLMAQDLNSLLEQFEATEKVNVVQPAVTSPSSFSPPRPSNQTIRDALPAEVINRIKASRENHKKMISLIPAMPSKKLGKTATRMQDAGVTLSRNKLLKLVTGGSGGETVTVQLDHDYCSGNSEADGTNTGNSSRNNSYYVTDSSEYPSQSSTPESRISDFYKSRERVRAADNSSRKDSGLESGENSEDETPGMMTSQVLIKSSSGLKSVNVVTEKGFIFGSKFPSIKAKNVPMVSVLKKNLNLNVEKCTETKTSCVQVTDGECLSFSAPCSPSDNCVSNDVEVKKKKRKLNLQEYRVRREERDRTCSQESSRANSPAPTEATTVHHESPTPVNDQGVPKEKPVMHSVEVQTQTFDFVDLTTSKSPKDKERLSVDRRERRNDLKHRSYRSRNARSSSSSNSASSEHRRSHRRKNSPKRKRQHKNSVSRMWSRSPSSSSSSGSRESSGCRSRSRDERRKRRSHSPHRSRSSSGSHHRIQQSDGWRQQRRSSFNRDRSWQRQRSRSPIRSRDRHWEAFNGQEKVRQVEERRVIYVGRIEEGTTKADLRRRFQQFGEIVDISVHFRERGDNYGFVTFAYQADAYQAVEHGNDNPKLPHYDLCFGGRRAFCKQRYADLDGLATVRSQYGGPLAPSQPRPTDSFDFLLHEVKSKLLKRPAV